MGKNISAMAKLPVRLNDVNHFFQGFCVFVPVTLFYRITIIITLRGDHELWRGGGVDEGLECIVRKDSGKAVTPFTFFKIKKKLCSRSAVSFTSCHKMEGVCPLWLA